MGNPFVNRIIGYTTKKASELTANPANWRTHPEKQRRAVQASLRELGWIGAVVENVTTGFLVDGHERVWQALKNDEEVPVLQVRLSESEEKLALSIFDPITYMAETDAQVLDALLREVNTGEEALQELLASMADEAGLYQEKKDVDAAPQVDRAEELRQKWGVESGQLWQLGEHKIICGDCTDAAVVARLMGGERAALCHADPPYGMGKESEGIANDNLYRDKLDAFQMSWWRTCRAHLDDNASAYIWGNAEDLWRMWFCGGLRDSERLTLRNEIVWQKQGAQGIGSPDHRMYATASERALFFMLGEQGFNNNADNYWEGWDGIVDYLESQRQAAGWSIKDTKRIAGHSEKSGCHWFDKSQWSMPTREVYEAWQKAARNDAFKRDYDAFKRDYGDIKREFYATRAFFDNAHDNMTDVWDFGRVQGDDRHEHATPKPVPMVARAIKSSAPDGAIVYAPFSGTGPEIIACEQLGRKCRAAEISPGYVAVALQRWADATSKTPVLLDTN